MIVSLLIFAAWQTVNLLLLFGAARLGVVRLTVTRPARPRKNTETTP